MAKQIQPERYSATAVVLHWAIAFLVFVVLGLGLYGSNLENLTGAFLINLHKVLGLSILALTVIRIVWRLTHRVPPLPVGTALPVRWAAHGVHAFLYILLLVQPLFGWLLTSAFPQRHAIMIGTLQIPFLPVTPDLVLTGAAHSLHEAGGWSMIALISLHIAAALWHQFFMQDRLITRMILQRGPATRN